MSYVTYPIGSRPTPRKLAYHEPFTPTGNSLPYSAPALLESAPRIAERLNLEFNRYFACGPDGEEDHAPRRGEERQAAIVAKF